MDFVCKFEYYPSSATYTSARRMSKSLKDHSNRVVQRVVRTSGHCQLLKSRFPSSWFYSSQDCEDILVVVTNSYHYVSLSKEFRGV